MELAGLEPATSWVRLQRKPLPCSARLRGLAQPRRSQTTGVAIGCHPSPWLLDQNLTRQSRPQSAEAALLRSKIRPATFGHALRGLWQSHAGLRERTDAGL